MAHVTVGMATAGPGSVATYRSIEVTKLAGDMPLGTPVAVNNDTEPGPCFWVDGAIHDGEPAGPMGI